MGDCIYIRGASGSHPTEEREVPSERWADGQGAEVGRILGKDHFANTTLGIWFYWSDLQDKAKLRSELLALVDLVTDPGYRNKEIERARSFSAYLRSAGEDLRRQAADENKED